MSKVKGFDSKCYELAQHFSDNNDLLTEEELCALAEDVQATVETFFSWREALITVQRNEANAERS